MMSGIRGTDTQPEMLVRRYLHATGLRFRVHVRSLPGRPDIVLPRYRAAVFIHGCFWHRHPGCRMATTPATRPEFWAAKFASNVTRDASNEDRLALAGWRVITIWECEVGNPELLDRLFWEIVSGE
ncbi:DNA mismatch endonuclease Vsr [Variovorax paradoxus]|nr:DNA mismatch endonuclease Vsr [Variovorax paradoxus]